MDNIFFLKIIISFLIAGIWIASTTLFTERFGSKIGGLVSNLPSTILISLVFVAIVKDTSYVVQSVPAVPIGMLIDTIFLFIFIILLPLGLIISTIISLLSWFLLALLATSFNPENLTINIIAYVIVTIVTFFILEKIIKIPSAEKIDKKYTKTQMLIRALFAGSIVSSVIYISVFFNPYIVGIFSTFPAVMLTTMIILTINQNRKFAQATGKILVLSSSNIVIYGLGVYFTYMKVGIIWGTIISFSISALWIGICHQIVRRVT